MKCAHCSKTFRYESERKRHELSHTSQHECKICNKKYSFLSALQRHEKQHERTCKIKCEQCGKSFQDATLLKRHTNYKHKGLYKCTMCDAVLNSEVALKTHKNIHTPTTQRRYKCTFESCKKTFNFSHHLKHHQLTHTNEKQYFCSICEKGFIQQHHWKAHKTTHTKDSWFTCDAEPSCSKRFSTKYALRRHLLTHSSKTQHSRAIKKEIEEENVESKRSLVTKQATQENNNPCNGCSIRDSCDIINKRTNKCCTKNKEIPLTECKKDGTVKLVDIFDIDFEYGNKIARIREDNENLVKEMKARNEEEMKARNEVEMKTRNEEEIKTRNEEEIKEETITVNYDEKKISDTILYNSCKEVLGNCIVSDDGSVGDGCLCAKMAAEDQISAQEIDEITPIEWQVS